MACLRAGAVQIPRARGRLHEAVRRTESQADGAGGVVVAVRQAPATCPAILSGTSRARCLRSPRLRASAAERNWSIYGKIKPKVSPRSARSSGATPRPTSLEARLLLDKAQDAGYKAPVWRSGTPTPTRTRAMTRRGSWCRGEAVEAGRRAGDERGRTGRETVRRETRGCIGRHKQRTYLTDVFTVPWRVDTYCITYLTHE